MIQHLCKARGYRRQVQSGIRRWIMKWNPEVDHEVESAGGSRSGTRRWIMKWNPEVDHVVESRDGSRIMDHGSRRRSTTQFRVCHGLDAPQNSTSFHIEERHHTSVLCELCDVRSGIPERHLRLRSKIQMDDQESMKDRSETCSKLPSQSASYCGGW